MNTTEWTIYRNHIQNVMPKDSKRYRYKTVTLPEPLLKEIEDFINKHPELGYGSITDFIKDAARDHMRDFYLVKSKK